MQKERSGCPCRLPKRSCIKFDDTILARFEVQKVPFFYFSDVKLINPIDSATILRKNQL